MSPGPNTVKRDPAPRILVADDSAAMRTYLSTILVSLGYDVVQAPDGATAFDRVLAEDFDLVVTDLEMRPMTGFELIAAIGLLPAWRRPRIIVCSASEFAGPVPAELRRVDYVLSKPVKLEDLASSVLAVLARRQKASGACGA